jgi:hypothetical protein
MLCAYGAGIGGLIGQEAGRVLGVVPAIRGALDDLLAGRGQRLAHLGGHHGRDLVLLAVRDGAAWRRLHGLWQRLGPHLLDALFVPFPPVRPGG